MELVVDIKIKCMNINDLNEISELLQRTLVEKYILIPSRIVENKDEPGCHQFIRLKPLPKIEGSGREW